MPVIEVIPITDELRSAISNNKDRKLIQKIIYKNNTSIIEDTFAKVINGETTFNEAIRVMDIKIDFTEEDNEIKEFIAKYAEIRPTLPYEIDGIVEFS